MHHYHCLAQSGSRKRRLQMCSSLVSSLSFTILCHTVQSSRHTCCECLCMLKNQHILLIKPRKLETLPFYRAQSLHAHHLHKWLQSLAQQLYDKHLLGNAWFGPIPKHEELVQLQQNHKPSIESFSSLHPKTDRLSKERLILQLLGRIIFFKLIEIRFSSRH